MVPTPTPPATKTRPSVAEETECWERAETMAGPEENEFVAGSYSSQEERPAPPAPVPPGMRTLPPGRRAPSTEWRGAVIVPTTGTTVLVSERQSSALESGLPAASTPPAKRTSPLARTTAVWRARAVAREGPFDQVPRTGS